MSTVLVILVAVAIAVLVWAWRTIGEKYRPLFDDEHLFAELPARLASLRSAALAQPGEPLSGPTDQRLGTTSAGLGIVYTTEELPQGILNHLSLSWRGGPLAFAFSSRCAYFMLTSLGVDPRRVAVAHSDGGILHVAFLVQASDRHGFLTRRLAVPPPDGIGALKEQAEEWKHDLLDRQLVFSDEGTMLSALVGTT